MQDPSQNLDAKKQFHKLQVELTMLEADRTKNNRKIEELNLELVKIKRQKELLELDAAEKDQALKKLDGQQLDIANEIRKLKKKINQL